MTIISITGHRPDKLGGYGAVNPMKAWVQSGLKTTFEYLKPTKVIVGMALGVDQWAAHVALSMGIPFVAAIPCQGQSSTWPQSSKDEYDKLLSFASEVVMCDDGPYAPYKMFKRNEWMVDHSDLLLAIWDGSDGGTKNCVDYAQKVGRPMFQINPNDAVL